MTWIPGCLCPEAQLQCWRAPCSWTLASSHAYGQCGQANEWIQEGPTDTHNHYQSFAYTILTFWEWKAYSILSFVDRYFGISMYILYFSVLCSVGCFIDFCFHPAAGGAKDVVAAAWMHPIFPSLDASWDPAICQSWQVIDAVQCHHPPRTVDYPSEMRQVQDPRDVHGGSWYVLTIHDPCPATALTSRIGWSTRMMMSCSTRRGDAANSCRTQLVPMLRVECLSWPQQEGVPREWWAIEPRFFQPKVPWWYAQNQSNGSDSLNSPWSTRTWKGSWCCTWRKLSDPVSDGGEDLVNLWLSAFG